MNSNASIRRPAGVRTMFAVISCLVALYVLLVLQVNVGLCSPFQASENQDKPKLAFRLAESTQSDKLQEMKVPVTDKKIFVHSESIIGHADIESVEIRKNSTNGREELFLRLTEQGGKRMNEVTSENVGKMLAVVFNEQVLVAPHIRSPLARELVLAGNFTTETLQSIVESLKPTHETTLQFSSEQLAGFKAFLGQLHKDKKLSGTALICRNGEVLFHESFGYVNIDDEKPLTENSSFRLASVSKQFTAMCIMMLAEDGKLKYDDELSKYIPELPYKGITIRHLLNHTGGLPDYMMLFARNWDKDKKFADKKMATNDDLVKLFAEHRPEIEFQAGEKYEYSNTGYVLLGEIVSRAAEQPVDEFIQTRIFDLLNMEHSAVNVAGQQLEVPERVRGFAWYSDGTVKEAEWHYLNGMIGDGGLYSSARDLVKWDLALKTDVLVNQGSLEEAFSPGTLNDGSESDYGFGWQLEKSKSGSLTVQHSGAWVGFRTAIVRDLETDVTFIFLSNNSFTNFDLLGAELHKLGLGL